MGCSSRGREESDATEAGTQLSAQSNIRPPKNQTKQGGIVNSVQSSVRLKKRTTKHRGDRRQPTGRLRL